MQKSIEKNIALCKTTLDKYISIVLYSIRDLKVLKIHTMHIQIWGILKTAQIQSRRIQGLTIHATTYLCQYAFFLDRIKYTTNDCIKLSFAPSKVMNIKRKTERDILSLFFG